MAIQDALSPAGKPPRRRQPTLKSHLAYLLLCTLALMLLQSGLRLALLIYNRDQIGTTPAATFFEAFGNGLRFDAKVTVYVMVPVLLATLFAYIMRWRGVFRFWLTAAASAVLLLGVMELDFYREFHQRLNGLVFQYMKEDPKTVLSMIWYGYPVARYLLAWALVTWLLSLVFKGIDRLTLRRDALATEAPAGHHVAPWYGRVVVFLVLLCVAVVVARGTLRQGPPLRWGDAFTTDSIFANQLGLNGTLSLVEAYRTATGEDRANIWKATLPQQEATAQVRQMLLTPNDRLIDTDSAAVRRVFTPPVENTLPGIKNVVVILLESFAGHSVGALGSDAGITPYFDALAKQGLLFDRFFSNGTHTHQGMFATMGCFPNLPGFEYLMQTPEGSHKLSGLPAQLSARQYHDVYVYNGDFAWDNQSGFFANQGMTTFIGRNDFVNPVFSDPTWGVSDQDMFTRGNEELDKLSATGKPFYALLQSLSNHVPYALPPQLPVERVTGHGNFDEHLTAMRYSDWALGQFFERAKKSPYYKDTLFVIVGDHGFGINYQVTELDLARFNVPMLMIAPGIQEKFGTVSHTVGTQVDIVPTIMGRLGGPTQHQCWGRDLLNLPAGDAGFGVIKPSGSEQTVGIVRGDRLLIESKELDPRLYHYTLGRHFEAERVDDPASIEQGRKLLESYIQTATKSLLDNTAGAQQSPRE
ncbi:LTA synthase family protein [Pseudomonas typographi]|uniref:LTA synthase family protein n=1 Tax=Pseudomonas typographi TaxID=2715964 RepID=UPI001686D474|nr:LTA synthase family protein [Pseudomonas typographi]MBD1586545.1 LTA synthase family protein [Pseudomonas typographi]